jgi:Fe-S-cluster containining protein
MSATARPASRPTDRRLIALVDAALAEAASRAGSLLACRPGCTGCCMGPFPISALDADRLRRGLAALERTDPARAARVRARARDAAARLTPGFPGDPRTGILGPEDLAEEAFCDAHASLPCPALDPDLGTCDLYRWRPLSCRTFGPPAIIGGEPLPPCSLCFVGASPGQVEACRVRFDPDDLEGALLARLEAAGISGETYVAFALAMQPETP